MILEFNDKPIKLPDEDKFGFNSLAETIAYLISKMKSPEGTVIAINGPWGSGKSSFINLVRYHLCDAAGLENATGILSRLINLVRRRLRNTADKDDLKIVNFKCWWFRGAEALTIEFFHALYSEMKPNMSRRAKKDILKLVPQLLAYTSPVIDSATGMPGSTLMAAKSVSNFIKQSETVENLHREISDALSKDTRRRYLIIIDDIDRLSPDEAMLIFRLVKSVGGLPNVMYLLAYDQQVAKKIVNKHYRSEEGAHYLEKIVQASFDLPEPSRATLENEFLARLDSVIEEREFGDGDYFRNLFAEMIAPEIKTPRDLIRILNPLKVTWPAVKGEVDPTEFLCLETLRIKRPELYATLRANKILLTGRASENISFSAIRQLNEKLSSEQCNKIFLETEPPSEHERLRDGLARLFPRLTGAWTAVNHIEFHTDQDIKRRVSAPKHFDTYFRFSLPEDLISRDEIERLIQKANDFNYIQSSLLKTAEIKLPDSRTKATHLLYELAIRTDRIPENHIGDLLKAMYAIADKLLEKEEVSNMVEGTVTQLNRLTHKLLIDRLPLETRSEVLLNACGQASLGYLSSIANGAYDQHFPTEGNRSKPQTECLMTEAHTVEVNDIALARIREAKTNGSLINCPLLDRVLFLWLRFDEEEVRSWISNVTGNNTAVARLSMAFIGQIQEDLFHNPATLPSTALRGKLGHVVDLDEFSSHADRASQDGNLEAKDHEALRIFLEAWHKQENRNNNAEAK